MVFEKESMRKIDPEGMLEDLDSFPHQCEEAISIGRSLELPFSFGQFERVVVTGMGGSAIVGDLLARLIDLPVVTNRGYYLPRTAGHDDLLLAISYSGNTEETLQALRDGIRRGMKAVCLSTGGKMEEFSRQQSVPLIKIPTGHQPRASTGYMLFPLLWLFAEAGQAGPIEFSDLLGRIEECTKSWNSEVPVENNSPKKLASKFQGKIPIIYGTQGNTKVVTYRWKTQVNENAKQPAFWNVFPELNHNETVGYELGTELMGNTRVIILKNGMEIERNRLRMKIMEEIFSDRGIGYSVVKAPEGNKFSKILGQIYFGDYFSVYLALLNEVDPSPVELIEDFKDRLKKAG